jgi:hypothetical protein
LQGHETPGFTVFFVMAAAAAAVGGKKQPPLLDFVDQDYVPHIDGNEVGDKDVDFLESVLGILLVAASSMQFVTALAMVTSRFHLHAPQAPAGVEDEGAAFAIAPSNLRISVWRG